MGKPPFTPLSAYFDWIAENDARARRIQAQFHAQIREFHGHHVMPGMRVLEWGSGAGDLLQALQPVRGLGLDFSPRMLAKARARHGTEAALEFRQADAQFEQVYERFDYIVLNFLTGYLTDIQKVLTQLHAAAHPRTRLVVTSLNYLWLWPLKWAQRFGWVTPQPVSNWLTTDDLVNLLELAGWEVVHNSTMQLLPFEIPAVSAFFNRFLARLPGLRWLGITLTLVARPRVGLTLSSAADTGGTPVPGGMPIFALASQSHRQAPRAAAESQSSGTTSCSVIVPVRNEAGNIRPALERIPTLGRQTEIIFVEGHSKDDTWEVVQREVAEYRGPHVVRAIQQPGKGKWDAVRAGFALARGAILTIQDGDLTAPPEDLPKFYDAIVSGNAEFANGSRLVYPMEKRAMRFLNFLGNKFFALSLSYVLGQPVKDSLCGTKMLLRSDYERLLKRIEPFGDFDPFGDFNLLFGASLLDLRIRDIPVRYKDRTYGETNISRFKHGWLLLRMTWFGLWKLRFV